MKDFIGVRHKWGTVIYRESVEVLKRDALLFTRIAIPDLYQWLYWPTREQNPSVLQLRWLVEKGIVFDPIADPKLNEWLTGKKGIVSDTVTDPTLDKSKVYQEIKSMYQEVKTIADQLKHGENQHLSLLAKGVLIIGADITVFHEYLARIVSAHLREMYSLDSLPILLLDLPSMSDKQIKRRDVINIALNTLPVPSPLTSWEQIIEYRSDSEAQGKFLALRNWANEIVRAGLTPAEVEDKLEWLLYDYKKHLELHKMKTDTGVLETIVVTGMEILEDIVKFNWSKAAKALFSIKHKNVDLLESELKSPSREIAYIYDIQQKF